MLKDNEEFIKRRKLSLMQQHTLLSMTSNNSTGNSNNHTLTTTSTPPITPPTPPPPPPSTLNMLTTTTTTTMMKTTNNSSLTNLNTTTSTLNMNKTPSPLPTLLSSTVLLATPPTNSATSSATTGTGAQVQDHYSLRWNNHQNHILRAFDALLQTKTLVDVTLVCAETSIRAHKMVLSACSPFFQRVFAETPCKHPVIVLKDFRGWVVQAIVDFMYRGEISVPQERLQTLIQAGESLQVRGLVESSVPEHTPTPAASPDDFGMIDTSLMSSEMERCSSFDEDTPSMVTAGSKVIMPSRLFGANVRRNALSERKREREREQLQHQQQHNSERELESDQELPNSDLCTSPMPRRKQARPRRRSGDLPLELNSNKPTSPSPVPTVLPVEPTPLATQIVEEHAKQQLAVLQTVIKSELAEPMDEDQDTDDHHHDEDVDHGTGADEADEPSGVHDSGHGNDSGEHNETHEKSRESSTAAYNEDVLELHQNQRQHLHHPDHSAPVQDSDEEDDDDDDELEHVHLQNHANEIDDDEPQDIEELINASNALNRRKSIASCHSDGPEDLCTTKKDHNNDTSGHHSNSDNECSPANNNNNSKLNNNNNRIVLSLKDIRHLNKPTSSSTPNSANSSMHPFAAASLRDLRLERAPSLSESQCNMDALEAQMHAAAAAAAVAAASGADNPFQHMEHQMDLSLAAAAAAAAAASHQHQQQQHQHQQSRERDHQALQREHRELQQQHNAYANSILGQMGMPPFGPGSGGPGSGGPAAHERLEESMNRLSKEFAPSSPMSLPTHPFNPNDGPPHPPSPLPFPGMSSALQLTPPHMFGLDSPLGLFPPGLDPGKLYNPLMEMSDPRGMPGDHPPPYLKKKMPRPKGQHSAPRGGPPRSWTNAELTEALQHVWNKKMTTSQASRIFGIPYNSLLMYVRGKYGKSLKLEQLRKDCISGPPLEMLQMGISGSSGKESKKESKKNRGDSSGGGSGVGGGGGSMNADMDLCGPPHGDGSMGPRSASSEPDLLGGPNSIFNPFNPQGFYPDFPGGFPGLPLSMLNLLPPSERHQHAAAAAAAMHHMGMDEDCKSDRSKQSSSLEEDFANAGGPLALNRIDEHRRGCNSAEHMLAVGGSAGGGGVGGSGGVDSGRGSSATGAAIAQQNGGGTQD